jgi:hypothetical protein
LSDAGSLVVNLPSRWFILLASGTEVFLWADSYTQQGADYVFGILGDATAEEQEHDNVEIVARARSEPARVEIRVARIPIGAFAAVSSEPF